MFQEANGGNVRHVRIVSDDGFICTTEWCESAANTNANARLIAAAPDLLNALQRLVRLVNADEVIYTGDHPVALAKEAITKATNVKV